MEEQEFSWSNLSFEDFCKGRIAEELNNYAGSEISASELAFTFTEGEAGNGLLLEGPYESKKFIQHFFGEADTYFQYAKQAFGDLVNPFDDPDGFVIGMEIKGVYDCLAKSDYIQEHWDDTITLDESTIAVIKSDLGIAEVEVELDKAVEQTNDYPVQQIVWRDEDGIPHVEMTKDYNEARARSRALYEAGFDPIWWRGLDDKEPAALRWRASQAQAEFTPEEDFKVIDRNEGLVEYIGGGGDVVVPPTIDGCVVRKLSCPDCGITNIDTTYNPALTYLDCRNNPITTLNLSHNPELRYLSCPDTNLTTLDLSHNPILLRKHSFLVDPAVQVQKTPQRVVEKLSFAAAKAAAVGARDARAKDVGHVKKHEQER